MVLGRFWLTLLVMMVVGALLGAFVGMIFGYNSHEAGWWLAGAVLGLFYGTITGISLAERS